MEVLPTEKLRGDPEMARRGPQPTPPSQSRRELPRVISTRAWVRPNRSSRINLSQGPEIPDLLMNQVFPILKAESWPKTYAAYIAGAKVALHWYHHGRDWVADKKPRFTQVQMAELSSEYCTRKK